MNRRVSGAENLATYIESLLNRI